jgi:hypothetical protein
MTEYSRTPVDGQIGAPHLPPRHIGAPGLSPLPTPAWMRIPESGVVTAPGAVAYPALSRDTIPCGLLDNSRAISSSWLQPPLASAGFPCVAEGERRSLGRNADNVMPCKEPNGEENQDA